MKKRFLCLVAVLVLCLSVCLTSCNKDKKTIWIFSGSLYFVSELRRKF